MKRHDPLPADSVTLYEKGAPIPASARKIGELTISGTGAETGKRYWQAVDQAVCATADAGGNALWLDELSETVSQHGTTYALNAAMFRIDSPDIAHPTAADPLPKAHGLKEGTATDGKRRQLPTHLFHCNIGAGFITSDLQMASDGTPYEGGTVGLAHNAGCDFITKAGFGAGLRYACLRMNAQLKSYDPSSRIGQQYDCKIGMHYVAPETCYSIVFGKKALLSVLDGIGYASYFERMDDLRGSVGGYGTHGVLPATLPLSKHLAWGLEIGGYALRFSPKKLGVEGYDGSTGINYLNIGMGLHYIF